MILKIINALAVLNQTAHGGTLTFGTSVDSRKQWVLLAQLLIIADHLDGDARTFGEHLQHIVLYSRRRHALRVAASDILGNAPTGENHDVYRLL